MRQGEAVQRIDRPANVLGARFKETYLTYAMIPIRDPGGSIVGALTVVQETTEWGAGDHCP